MSFIKVNGLAPEIETHGLMSATAQVRSSANANQIVLGSPGLSSKGSWTIKSYDSQEKLIDKESGEFKGTKQQVTISLNMANAPTNHHDGVVNVGASGNGSIEVDISGKIQTGCLVKIGTAFQDSLSGSGHYELEIPLSIVAELPPTITYGITQQNYPDGFNENHVVITDGSALSFLPQTTGTVNSYSISPTPPAAVTFNTATGQLDVNGAGSPFAIADFTISAVGPGGSGSVVVDMGVLDGLGMWVAGSFLDIAHNQSVNLPALTNLSNSLSSFSDLDGQLAAVGLSIDSSGTISGTTAGGPGYLVVFCSFSALDSKGHGVLISPLVIQLHP